MASPMRMGLSEEQRALLNRIVQAKDGLTNKELNRATANSLKDRFLIRWDMKKSKWFPTDKGCAVNLWEQNSEPMRWN